MYIYKLTKSHHHYANAKFYRFLPNALMTYHIIFVKRVNSSYFEHILVRITRKNCIIIYRRIIRDHHYYYQNHKNNVFYHYRIQMHQHNLRLFSQSVSHQSGVQSLAAPNHTSDNIILLIHTASYIANTHKQTINHINDKST